MLQAIVFDVDGVLVDSRRANARFFQNLLEAAGYTSPPSSEIHKYFHLSMFDAIARLIDSQDFDEIERVWKLGHDTALYPVKLLDYPADLPEVLDRLSRMYLLGIATSRIRQGMDALLNRGQMKYYFKVVITFDDYTHPKPDPEPLILSAEKLGVLPESAVYVGDSDNDIMAASAAGMKSVHLSKATNDKADVGIQHIRELPRAIEFIDNLCHSQR